MAIAYQVTNGDDPAFTRLCARLDETLDTLIGKSLMAGTYDQLNGREGIHDVVIAYDGAAPIACGGFKAHGQGSAELKRVFVEPAYQGQGIGAQLVARLETLALSRGFDAMVLESGNPLKAAHHLYHKLGYENIPNFAPYVGIETSTCMRKALRGERIEFRKMQSDEREQCVRLAADAFMDYEFFCHYVPREDRRRRFLGKMIDVEMRLNESQADTFVAMENGQIVAVAVLYPPTYRKPSDWAYMSHGFLTALLRGGLRDTLAWNAMNDLNDAPCHGVSGAWYINLLTVAPGHKGRGIGSRMLNRCIIPYIKEKKGTLLTLVTNSESNRRFYEKNHFVQFSSQEFVYKGNRTGSWSYQLPLNAEG